MVPESLAGAAGVSEPKGGSVTKPGPDSRTPPDTARQPDSKSATPPDAHVAAGSLPDAPQPLPKLVLPAKATIAQLEEAKKERERAIDKARQAVAAVETVRQDSVHRLESAKTEQASLLKNLESRRKTLAPVIQRAEGLEIERRKSEEALTKAQAAADQAAKAAATAKRAYDETVAKGGEKLQAKQQAEAELRDAAAELAGRSREVEDLGQLMTKADALRQQTRLAEQQLDQDLQKISASLDQARQAEMESQRKANQEKIAGLERQVQDLQTQLGRYNAALGPLKELGEVGKEAIKKIEEKVTVANKQIGDLQAEIKRLSGSVPPNVLPKKETTNGASTQAPPPQPGPVSAFTNSLGMKFLPVGDVQFSVYLTTRKNFDAFARATGLKSEAWRNPGFKQDDDDPVVNVTWREAEAFCKWLTEKERKSGQIKPNELYRLPTDLEWSRAVALPAESGATPEERDMGVQDVYPWGQEWPPPAGAGNYAGEETQTEIPIPNYNDGYPNTSPVGKFRPNALGLYDMGGNVWQWVSDFWNAENRAKTLRGGSWYNGAIPLSLLSSCRISSSPDTLHDTYGFRIVKTPEAPKARKR